MFPKMSPQIYLKTNEGETSSATVMLVLRFPENCLTIFIYCISSETKPTVTLQNGNRHTLG